MIEGITALLKNKLTSQTNILIKDFHDSCLQQTVPDAELIVENLTDGQIWHQMNQHLQKSITRWNKLINKTEPLIEQQGKRHQRGQQLEVQEQEEAYDNQQMEGDYEEDGQQHVHMQSDYGEEDNGEEQSDDMLEMEEQDVGLYGQLLDDENQEKYDHEEEQEDPELENLKMRLNSKNKGQEQQEEEDEFENQNFDHFREIEGQNKEQEEQNQEELDEISKLENRLLTRNDWRWKGEISSKQRPVNSLVENPMEFMRGLKFQQQGSPTENAILEDVIKRRILDDMFDDRVRLEIAPGFKQHFTNLPLVSVEKSKHSLGELYEMDFANSLGMKNNKEEKEKKEILDMFKELNYKLDRLSNFSFIPKPVIESKISSQAYILREENIPITATQSRSIADRLARINLKSQKQEGSQHLKTKRIKRQRRKEQEAKRMKRIIQYGGMSKVEALARKKIEKSKKGKSTKYSQSGQFFKKFQDNIASKDKSKPNPNIGKLKL